MSIFGKHISRIPTSAYKVAILVAAAIWGLAFVVMKDVVGVLSPAWLLGIRFTLSGILLGAIFFKRIRAAWNRDYAFVSIVLGLMMFAAFWVQTIGLAETTPGKNAFLTATYVVLVPFLYWIIARKRPSIFNVLAAALCIGGVGLVSMQGSLTIGFGDAMTLASAFLFAVHIAFTAKWTEKRDVVALTVFQFIVAGVCALLVGTFTEPWPSVEALLSPGVLVGMGYLIVFASCMAILFQNLALKHVPPAQVSIFLSTESLFGVLFSVALYGEEVTARLLAGFGLIFAAILVSEMLPIKRRGGVEEEMAEPVLAELPLAVPERALGTDASIAHAAAPAEVRVKSATIHPGDAPGFLPDLHLGTSEAAKTNYFIN